MTRPGRRPFGCDAAFDAFGPFTPVLRGCGFLSQFAAAICHGVDVANSPALLIGCPVGLGRGSSCRVDAMCIGAALEIRKLRPAFGKAVRDGVNAQPKSSRRGSGPR